MGKASRPLFRPGEVLETARLRLSAAGRDDIDQMPWLEAALAPDWNEEDLLPHIDAGEVTLISMRDSHEVGLAVVIAGRPENAAACVPFIAVDPKERFQGLGGEAALALERRAAGRWRVGRMLAPVPEQRGLALYFWLRIGFRPMTSADAPWPLLGLNGKPRPGVWMAREVF